MSTGKKFPLTSIQWTSLIIYLCAYITTFLAITIIGWALYHAKPKNPCTNPPTDQPERQNTKISYRQYFILYKQKSWILLSIFVHIITQACNFSVMIFFLHLSLSKPQDTQLLVIAVIALTSFTLYRFASAILIWRLSHSIRKSTFQIIDITILYQLLKGYKKKTRNNPSRIVQYINYLNAMFQSWSQATIQLIFLITQPLLFDNYNSFIYIIILSILFNLYCVIKAVYEKDMLLTSDFYRKNKTVQQISTHVLFRFVDISLRIITLSMLWITITYISVIFIIVIEFIIIGYLAYYTKQVHRLQELIAVILHISFDIVNDNEATDDEYDKSRPVTPATLRMTNELQVSLNVDIEEVERKEQERKRQRVSECQCFKWRIAANIIYIVVFILVARLEHISFVSEDVFGVVLTVYCVITALLYPFIYWMLKNSKRWNKNVRNSIGDNEYDIFGYLQRNDFESAKEIIDFGKKIENEEYVEWANNQDFSADNNPILLLKFLYQQSVKITSIVNKSQGGLNILHQICKNPELQNVAANIKFLIKLGFDIRGPTEKTEDTPLHIACSHCNKSVMLSLLNNGTGNEELLVKNKLKQTPLHSLMVGYNKKYEGNQILMTSILFEKFHAQKIVLEVDIYGKSALHIACKNKLCPPQIIKLLLENGAYSYQACNDDFYPKDHVEEWEESRKSDQNMVLKWLQYGLNEETIPLKQQKSGSPNVNINHGSTYIELSEDTRTVNSTMGTIATPKVLDKEEEEEEAEVYTDDEDEKEKEKKTQNANILTPMDPNPDTTLEKTLSDDNGDNNQQNGLLSKK